MAAEGAALGQAKLRLGANLAGVKSDVAGARLQAHDVGGVVGQPQRARGLQHRQAQGDTALGGGHGRGQRLPVGHAVLVLERVFGQPEQPAKEQVGVGEGRIDGKDVDCPRLRHVQIAPSTPDRAAWSTGQGFHWVGVQDG